MAKDADAEVVDLRFCDLPGLMQHFSTPITECNIQVSIRAELDVTSIVHSAGFRDLQDRSLRTGNHLLIIIGHPKFGKNKRMAVSLWSTLSRGRTVTEIESPVFFKARMEL
jgi:hypothetical protein